jgi:hypothetical protein
MHVDYSRHEPQGVSLSVFVVVLLQNFQSLLSNVM